jgi:hypothetical protein
MNFGMKAQSKLEVRFYAIDLCKFLICEMFKALHLNYNFFYKQSQELIRMTSSKLFDCLKNFYIICQVTQTLTCISLYDCWISLIHVLSFEGV